MRTILHKACFCAVSILLLPAVLRTGLIGQEPGRDYGKAINAVRSVIDKNLSAYDSPGISVAFVEGDHTVWSAGFGLADRANKIPATAQTIYELGSISKIFTCIAVMQLHEQKKIDIDKPYLDYVPEFSVKSRFSKGGEAITIRMLMTHHSGIVTDDDPWETTHPERYFYRALPGHVKTTSLLFPPGQRWHYSSFGVNLLGLLVERISGMEFAEYMRKNVLGPLGMPNASFDIKDLPTENIAAAYCYNPGWDLIPREEIRPAGSLRAPMQEAAHLVSMVFNRGEFKGKRILTPESVEEMTRSQDDENPLDGGNYMGLGFWVGYENLRNDGMGKLLTLWHRGVSRHRSVLGLIPKWNVGFIASVNDHNATRAILRGVEEGLLKEIFAMHGQTYGYATPLPKRAEANRDLQKRVVGEYASIYGYRLLQLTQDGMLILEAPGAQKPPDSSLLPQGNGDFVMDMGKSSPLVFHFETSPHGEITAATLRRDGKVENSWLKLAPAKLPSGWDEYAGVYEPRDAEVRERTGIPEIKILREGGRLLVKAAITPANEGALGREYSKVLFPLRPLDDARAEVVNGALSGYFGYTFAFGKIDDVLYLKLHDAVGAAVFKKKK